MNSAQVLKLNSGIEMTFMRLGKMLQEDDGVIEC